MTMKMARGFALAAALTAGLAQQPVKPQHTAAEMEPILAQVARFDAGQSREGLFHLTMFVQDSMGSPALVGQIEARLLQFLQSDATAAGKEAVSIQLSLIATEKSIPALSAMLLHPETAEMARYALARIPGSKADDALRKALDETSGTVKIGIINSLGERRDAKAVPMLQSLPTSSDPGIAAAAIDALGNIANRQALDALNAARGKVSGPLQKPVLEAYLQCAGRLAQSGDKNDALTVYKRLLSEQVSPMAHVAALNGIASVEGKNALATLSAQNGSQEPEVQDAAIRLIAGIPGRDSTVALMDRFGSLPAPAQVRLLAALAEHGDVTARPLLTQAAKGNSAAVRTAALAGLGKLGDEGSVGLLAEAAASGQTAEQAAGRQSLSELRGPGIDTAIVAAIGASSGNVKAELILAADERGSTAAAGALIQAVHQSDPDVRRSALRALRNVAGPAQVPALLEIVKTSEAPDRDATQALAAALKRSPPAEMSRAISAYKATSSLAPRLALIEAMGQTSSGDVLALLRDCLKDSNPEIERGAILALTGWADPAPLPDLLAIAKTSADPTLQVLSVRGCLKLIAAPSQHPIRESAKLLAGVMPLAKQPAEKKAVLALLPVYPCEESLQVAQDSLGDQTVANEAKASVERIKSALNTR
jgi:HEAT repeat protein